MFELTCLTGDLQTSELYMKKMLDHKDTLPHCQNSTEVFNLSVYKGFSEAMGWLHRRMSPREETKITPEVKAWKTQHMIRVIYEGSAHSVSGNQRLAQGDN